MLTSATYSINVRKTKVLTAYGIKLSVNHKPISSTETTVESVGIFQVHTIQNLS